MSHRKKWKGRAHDASAEVLFQQALRGEGEPARKPFNPREDRKTLQLCRQVQRAVMLALAGECADEVLRDVYVESVEPMGGASQLLVLVTTPAGSSLDVLARLNERSARLRAVVARSVNRKRAPNLSFAAVPAGARPAEGGLP